VAWTPRRSRLRLRARLTLAFGLGALLLSVLLSALAYGLTRSNLIERREETALEVVSRNAQQADRRITDDLAAEDIPGLLRDLVTVADATPVIRLEGVDGGPWFSAESRLFRAEDLDQRLFDVVSGDADPDGVPRPAQIRYTVRDAPFLLLGVPLSQRDAIYFEAVPLDDIEDTLRALGLALLGASALTTMAGVAFGTWASRRVLRPLEDVSGTAERIAAGDLSARLEVAEDRDLIALAASFNEMAANLEERIERDAQFASDVSHELRSPLMTIMASVEVLNSRRDDLPDRQQMALDLLTSDLERFRQLVGDLLEISRYDVGAQSLDLDEFGIIEFVRRVAAEAEHTSIPVIAAAELETTVVAADKRRLARVIANLLDNARYYAGGATAIEVTTFGDTVEVAVEDAGPGVPEEERAVIFARFARGSEGGRRGAGTGTGLGLALVSEHVRLHGGRVRVDDRPDGQSGARFVVSLPIVLTEEDLDDVDSEWLDQVAPAHDGAETDSASTSTTGSAADGSGVSPEVNSDPTPVPGRSEGPSAP
jgi:two-component system, OmpR family, sensor histidine kinase MtrB